MKLLKERRRYQNAACRFVAEKARAEMTDERRGEVAMKRYTRNLVLRPNGTV